MFVGIDDGKKTHFTYSFFNHFQAKMDLARKLLSLHAEFDSDPFVSLDELLRKMPIYNSGILIFFFCDVILRTCNNFHYTHLYYE